MSSKYPKVYYQLQAMVRICERTRARVKDLTYLDALIIELNRSCEDIECAHLDDNYTGELHDLADLEIQLEENDRQALDDENADDTAVYDKLAA